MLLPLPSPGLDSSRGRHSRLAPRLARHCHPPRDACPPVCQESFRSTLEAACAAVDPAPAYATAPASSFGTTGLWLFHIHVPIRCLLRGYRREDRIGTKVS